MRSPNSPKPAAINPTEGRSRPLLTVPGRLSYRQLFVAFLLGSELEGVSFEALVSHRRLLGGFSERAAAVGLDLDRDFDQRTLFAALVEHLRSIELEAPPWAIFDSAHLLNLWLAESALTEIGRAVEFSEAVKNLESIRWRCHELEQLLTRELDPDPQIDSAALVGAYEITGRCGTGRLLIVGETEDDDPVGTLVVTPDAAECALVGMVLTDCVLEDDADGCRLIDLGAVLSPLRPRPELI